MSDQLTSKQRTGLIIGAIALVGLCLCIIVAIWLGRELLNNLGEPKSKQETTGWDSAASELTVAVSPGMARTLATLAEQFNARAQKTPDGSLMLVQTLSVVPEKMVEESLTAPSFQAIAPDSSLWLNQLDRRWIEAQSASATEESTIPIGNRRFGDPVRYATSPVVIAAWESVARDLGWPGRAVGWQDIQEKATADEAFKWNHPSTGHASGLLATLAEFYAGAGLTRGLTPEAATAESTLDYVRAVEATVRFYGEGEDVIVQRLAAEGRDFLDAFVAQEHVVIAWNQSQPGERLVAIYPAEGTLWADHPLALLELGAPGEAPVTDNQRRTYQAFVDYLLSPEVQRQLLAAGYRPADMDLRLDEGASPFVQTDAADWRQPQTTLQIPAESVVEVVRNVWWYTKRPTNVYLVVDASGSMEGDKIELTRAALQSFVEQIRGDRDRAGLTTFASSVQVRQPLQPLTDAGRAELNNAINNIEAAGNTALIDGVWQAYTALQMQGDPEAINAIVVMTDGHENHSRQTLVSLRQRIEQEQGTPVVIFTIAFGTDADEKVMRALADIGNGQFRRADETDIEELYKIISTYF